MASKRGQNGLPWQSIANLCAAAWQAQAHHTDMLASRPGQQATMTADCKPVRSSMARLKLPHQDAGAARSPHVEHIPMRLLHLIKQNHTVGPAAHCLCQLATLQFTFVKSMKQGGLQFTASVSWPPCNLYSAITLRIVQCNHTQDSFSCVQQQGTNGAINATSHLLAIDVCTPLMPTHHNNLTSSKPMHHGTFMSWRRVKCTSPMW
eukprot:scaffold49640_cov22-Tisochrysis_lutea.AAC.1